MVRILPVIVLEVCICLGLAYLVVFKYGLDTHALVVGALLFLMIGFAAALAQYEFQWPLRLSILFLTVPMIAMSGCLLFTANTEMKIRKMVSPMADVETIGQEVHNQEVPVVGGPFVKGKGPYYGKGGPEFRRFVYGIFFLFSWLVFAIKFVARRGFETICTVR